MSTPHALDILFLTNFSDYCFRSIPAIAQIADSLKVRLTIMHVFDPTKCRERDAEAKLQSFFPEADRYQACCRTAVPGNLLDAVSLHMRVWPVNLIVAPASDPIGLPRIGDRSRRARMIEQCGVPLWTIGRATLPAKLVQPVKNVACWLDFYSQDTQHLAFAIEYARKVDARLHVMRSLPPVTEGTVLAALEPGLALHPKLVAKQIRDMCAPVAPEIHVSTGEGRSAVTRLLRECDADIAFLPKDETFWSKWLGLGLHIGDGIPCPAVYIGEKLGIPAWNLEQRASARPSLPVQNDHTVRPMGSRNAASGWAWLPQSGLF